jgi:K+-transporting ATPase ATPase C chain
MWQMTIIALRVTAVTLVLTGILYPLAMTGLAQLLFPDQANGSLVRAQRGRIVGSELIGQNVSSPAYFQPRPSAAGDNGYDATASSGSNLGPTSRTLRARIATTVARLRETNPDAVGPVPIELVTASASGLDPHLSLAAAAWQIPRIARARRVTAGRVAGVVEALAEGRDLGLLGEPRVNVLLLNVALDQQFGQPEVTAGG